MSPSLLLLWFCLASFAATKTAPLLFFRRHAEIHFERFILEHNKQYVNEAEKQARLEIFRENLEKINVLNQQSEHAVFGITQFSDLTPDEFVEKFTGLGVPSNLTVRGCRDISDHQVPNYNAPESHDWRQYNAVTRVKNQHHCGGCYAFSASGNIEGQYAIKHGQLIELSEQQTVDCDRGSNGCRGGFMSSAFRSIIQQGGIETEAGYPYVGTQQVCQFTPGKAAVRVTDCVSFNIRSQEALKQLVYKVGPISVGVQASNFHFYHGGVMPDNLCNAGGVNHAVLVVGYGVDNGVPYWLIKNSWGEEFGEQGYIKIHRGENAASCGMMNNGFMASSTVM